MASKANILTSVAVATAAAIFSASAFADVDAVAAKKLARKEHCLRCHAVDKKKEGPSYQSVAYKYKGQADAQDKLVGHITSGNDRVKLSDGHMEDHKVTKANEAQVKNLIGWILAQ